jgi:hypothetical protein
VAFGRVSILRFVIDLPLNRRRRTSNSFSKLRTALNVSAINIDTAPILGFEDGIGLVSELHKY